MKRWLLVAAPLTLAMVFAMVLIAGCGGSGLPPLRLYVTGAFQETDDPVEAIYSAIVKLPYGEAGPVIVSLSSDSPRLLPTYTGEDWEDNTQLFLFNIEVVNDSTVEIVDPQTVTLTAHADGYADDEVTVFVYDDDGLSLSLIIPSDATEGFADPGDIGGTVIIPEATSWDVVVALSSDGPDRLSTPASVVILAGETYANFTMTLLNNSIVDADPDPVIITASSTGYTSDNDTINLHDNDGLVVTFAGNPVAENAGAVGGTVTVPRDPVVDLIVTLTSSDTAAAAVQTQAVISTGAGPTYSVTFQAFPLDNDTYAGDTFSVITASCSNYENATNTLFITEDDPPLP